jgi:hypothetical protein
VLYRIPGETQVGRSKNHFHHGKSQEEAPSQDVEAQTPEAPQGEPPQEAHLAEVKAFPTSLRLFVKPALFRGGFFHLGAPISPVKH